MATPEQNRPIIEEFRANHGVVASQGGGPMLLLTTTGAKSGLPRTSPMLYLPDGDRYLVFASAGGAPEHPLWFRNLLADPNVTVEVGDETFAGTATVLDDPERSEAYARQIEAFPVFADFQAKTDRVIPVVALSRSGA